MNFKNNYLNFLCLAVVFILGVILDRCVRYYPYLKFDSNISILAAVNFLFTVLIAFLIPFYINKLIEEKRGAKAFIVEELKDLIKIVLKIKSIISDAHERGKFESRDRDSINYVFHEAELEINSIQAQIKEAFDTNHELTCSKLSSLLSDYKDYVTGGELMNSSFVKVDERYYHENNTEYSKMETGFKILIHGVHKF